MRLIVTPSDPRAPDVARLIEESHALMASLFPPQHNAGVDIDSLGAPDVTFYTARLDGTLLGTAALAHRAGYGELKAMYVAPAQRGRGAGDALMRQAVAEAQERGLPYLRLETGNALHSAIRLYTRHGFTPCPPFGDYAVNGTSLFLEKRLPSV